MTLPLLICDDSALARKQLAKSLPGGWDISVSFASNGVEALDAVRAGKGDLLFLDLNMPVMDGFEVLEEIRKQDLGCLVLVVSGDVQPEAKQRVLSLGALAFIQKPINTQVLAKILQDYGIISSAQPQTAEELARFNQELGLLDLMQETLNIAMGQAGKRLGELLNTYIHLPVPQVKQLSYHQLPGQLACKDLDSVSASSQGFIGAGIAGEALILLDDVCLSALAEVLSISPTEEASGDLEVLTDVASLLAGACLKGFAEQLDINFSLGHPVILGRQASLTEIFNIDKLADQPLLAVEIEYILPEQDVGFDLLLLFTQDSQPALVERTGYLR